MLTALVFGLAYSQFISRRRSGSMVEKLRFSNHFNSLAGAPKRSPRRDLLGISRRKWALHLCNPGLTPTAFIPVKL